MAVTGMVDSCLIANTGLHRRKVDAVVHAIKWQTASRDMMVEAFAQIDTEETDPGLSITTKAA